jgi:hypothetical protein
MVLMAATVTTIEAISERRNRRTSGTRRWMCGQIWLKITGT